MMAWENPIKDAASNMKTRTSSFMNRRNDAMTDRTTPISIVRRLPTFIDILLVLDDATMEQMYRIMMMYVVCWIWPCDFMKNGRRVLSYGICTPWGWQTVWHRYRQVQRSRTMDFWARQTNWMALLTVIRGEVPRFFSWGVHTNPQCKFNQCNKGRKMS